MRVVCIPAATRKLWKGATGIEIIDGIGDDEGYFVFQARTDDMIISAGYNIAGPEVEGPPLPPSRRGAPGAGECCRRAAQRELSPAGEVPHFVDFCPVCVRPCCAGVGQTV